MIPDEMLKLPVTCVRFHPVSLESDDQSEHSHIVAATCKHSTIISSMLLILINAQSMQNLHENYANGFRILGAKIFTHPPLIWE